MSLRSAQLCDHDGCNYPADTACPLCKRDSCRTHSSKRYIAVVVLLGHGDASDVSRLGQSPRAVICGECANHLNNASVTLNYTGPTPLDAFVAPMKDGLVEAVTALLAEKKLDKKPG